MLNGVNGKDGILNSNIEKQAEISKVVTNPLKNPYQNIDKNLLIDETAISKQALKLYEKEQEVKQFSSLVLSDPENLSHEEIVSKLFDTGIIDPMSEEALTKLSENQKLWDDLDNII